jgi:hypothetical protein
MSVNLVPVQSGTFGFSLCASAISLVLKILRIRGGVIWYYAKYEVQNFNFSFVFCKNIRHINSHHILNLFQEDYYA